MMATCDIVICTRQKFWILFDFKTFSVKSGVVTGLALRKRDFGNKSAVEQKRIVFERELRVFVDVDSMNIVGF